MKAVRWLVLHSLLAPLNFYKCIFSEQANRQCHIPLHLGFCTSMTYSCLKDFGFTGTHTSLEENEYQLNFSGLCMTLYIYHLEVKTTEYEATSFAFWVRTQRAHELTPTKVLKAPNGR